MVKAMMESCRTEKFLQSLDQNGRSPLHYCAFSIHSRCIISYIAQECGEGMDVNHQDNRGRTPLHTSISSGNLAGVVEFLTKGADPFVKDNEGHNAMHFAVLHNRKAIVEALRETPYSDELASEPNKKGYSPIHIGLKLGLEDIMSILTSTVQLRPDHIKDPQGNNYIHLAASSGNWKALTAFLELANANKLLNETNNHGATPLHCASKNGHSHCIELLLNSGAMVHKSHKGVSPLMLACRNGNMECVKLLYKAHPFQIDWQDNDGETALHYAAHSGSPSMIQNMLDVGGKVMHNDSGKSFLDIIIADGNEECGLAVVNHRRWQECLDVVSPVVEPPMLGLVRKMPNIAKTVLDRCHTKQGSHKNCTANCAETFNFKYLLTDLQHEAESSNRNAVTTSSPAKHPPPVLARASTKQQLLNEVVIENLEAVQSDMKNMTMQRSFSTLAKHPAVAAGKRGFSPSMEVLKRMIQHKRVDLLVHPVVSAYMNKKWKSYGWFVYFLYSGSLALLVFSLTMFVILSPTLAYRNRHSASQNSSDTDNSTMLSSDASENATNTSFNNYSTAQQQIFRWLAVAANCLFAAVILSGIVAQGFRSVNFVSSILLWNGTIAIVLNFVFLLSPDPFAPNRISFGAGACFFTWMVMFGALEFINVVGVYVHMFFRILSTVIQVLCICFFLLMAFALSMYVIASQVTEFSSLGFSIFSVFGYMLGEVQYSLFIEKASSKESSIPNSSAIILLIMVLAVMMSIVMANLLVGLAVGDIEQIKLNATYKRRELEAAFFCMLDHYAPKCIGHIIAPTSWTIHKKMCMKTLFGLLIKKVKGEADGLDALDDESYFPRTNASPVDLAQEMAEIKQKLQSMSDLLHLWQDGDQDRRRTQKCLRWQRPQSTLSMDSSDSDISMTASDFLAELA